MPRLVFITTAPIALRNLCVGQLDYFRRAGYEVTAIANPGEDLNVVADREKVQVVPLAMAREITLFADLVSLWRMWRVIRKLNPDIVAAATPKAALLGMLAAWAARVPVRVYMQWGLRLETVSGLKRKILAWTERISAACSHCVLCVSESLRTEFVEAGFARREKTIVLLNGSSNGVLVDQFTRTAETRAFAEKFRSETGVRADDPIIGFVGRFVKDKGIVDLVDAFNIVLKDHPNAWLLLVGQYEAGDPIPQEYVQRIAEHPRIIRPGWVTNVTPYYSAMTLLALPTYREGFPNVVLHASAAELPVVAFRATGALDSVSHGETGTLVDLNDVAGLARAIAHYLEHPECAKQQGIAGRARVLKSFQPEPIWIAMDQLFRRLLAEQTADNRAAVGFEKPLGER